MAEFWVWAPRAETMTLAVADQEIAMTPRADGWWAAAVSGDAGRTGGGQPEVQRPDDGIDYGFRIDGGPVRPDPRSRRQPHGVHERSRTFDPHQYRWSDTDWTGRQLAGAVIYELHIGTFTTEGTFDAAIDRLDHLVDLGIDFVEVLPVNGFNGVWNWGYDGVAWFAIHEPYGGPAGYQRFVDACHARGMGVIQDVVYNHLGASGNYLPEFGPYLREDSANTWGASVNLDGPGSDEVRRYILDNARMWLADYHVDGLRLDAVHALVDHRALPILEELAAATGQLAQSLGRALHLIAESDLNDARLMTPRDAGGAGLAAAWDDDIHHALHVAVTGETAGYYADFAPLAALAKVLTDGYFHDGSYSSFRGRSHGRPIDKARVAPWRLVASIQNHDQIGNRAAGDRLSHQAGMRAQAVAAVLLLAAPFTPMLFMGEEWAATTPWPFFTSHPEPDLADKTRAGRFAEFARHGWDAGSVPDPQDPGTFRSAVLRWSELTKSDHAAMLQLYRNLLRLRHTHPALVGAEWPDTAVRFDEAERWLVYRRGSLAVAANFSDSTRIVPLGPRLVGDILLATDHDCAVVRVGGAPAEGGVAATPSEGQGASATSTESRSEAIALPPMSAAIVEYRKLTVNSH